MKCGKCQNTDVVELPPLEHRHIGLLIAEQIVPFKSHHEQHDAIPTRW